MYIIKSTNEGFYSLKETLTIKFTLQNLKLEEKHFSELPAPYIESELEVELTI